MKKLFRSILFWDILFLLLMFGISKVLNMYNMQFLSWTSFSIVIIFIILFMLGTIQIYKKEKLVCIILCFVEVFVVFFVLVIFGPYLLLNYNPEEIVIIDNKKMIKETHSFLLSNWINYYDYQNIFLRSKQVRIKEAHDDYIGDYLYTIYYDDNGNIIKREEKEDEVTDETLVKIKDYIPNIIIDLKYATEDNFTKQVIYEDANAYLRYGTIKKLLNVQNELNENGYTLVIWDAYRPVSAQFKLWEFCPDSKYVSNPNKGYSSHSRGNTIDVTIAKLDGTYIEMPSKFDDFSLKADRNYDDVSDNAKNNSLYLEKIMTKYDFKGYKNEWWHYTDNLEYDILK